MQDHFTTLYGENAFENPANFDSAGNFKPQRLFVRDSEAEAASRRTGMRRGYQVDTATPVSHEAAKAFEEKRTRLDTSRRNVSDGASNAKQAYEERNERLSNAWRSKDKQATITPAHAHDAKGLADSAWQEKKDRLQNGWRNR